MLKGIFEMVSIFSSASAYQKKTVQFWERDVTIFFMKSIQTRTSIWLRISLYLALVALLLCRMKAFVYFSRGNYAECISEIILCLDHCLRCCSNRFLF